MIQNRPIFVVFLFFLFLSNLLSGQNEIKELDYYNWYDSVTGVENSELHQGVVYVERHRTKSKKTKFFPEPDFVLGSIIFDGQPYFDLNLKYDVYDDELLMRVDKRLGGNIIQLYKTKLSGFTIGHRDFVKINDSKIKPGFYEVALKKPLFLLFKKHLKKPVQRLGKKLVFYDFEDGDKECFLYHRKNYHSIKRISDLTKLFPEHSEQLNSFHKNQNSNSDFDVRLEGLLGHLDTLLNETTTKTAEN